MLLIRATKNANGDSGTEAAAGINRGKTSWCGLMYGGPFFSLSHSSEALNDAEEDEVVEVRYRHHPESAPRDEDGEGQRSNTPASSRGITTSSAVAANEARRGRGGRKGQGQPPAGLGNASIATMDQAVYIPRAIRGAGRRTMFDVLAEVQVPAATADKSLSSLSKRKQHATAVAEPAEAVVPDATSESRRLLQSPTSMDTYRILFPSAATRDTARTKEHVKQVQQQGSAAEMNSNQASSSLPAPPVAAAAAISSSTAVDRGLLHLLVSRRQKAAMETQAFISVKRRIQQSNGSASLMQQQQQQPQLLNRYGPSVVDEVEIASDTTSSSKSSKSSRDMLDGIWSSRDGTNNDDRWSLATTPASQNCFRRLVPPHPSKSSAAAPTNLIDLLQTHVNDKMSGVKGHHRCHSCSDSSSRSDGRHDAVQHVTALLDDTDDTPSDTALPPRRKMEYLCTDPRDLRQRVTNSSWCSSSSSSSASTTASATVRTPSKTKEEVGRPLSSAKDELITALLGIPRHSGQRASGSEDEDDEVYLPEWAWRRSGHDPSQGPTFSGRGIVWKPAEFCLTSMLPRRLPTDSGDAADDNGSRTSGIPARASLTLKQRRRQLAQLVSSPTSARVLSFLSGSFLRWNPDGARLLELLDRPPATAEQEGRCQEGLGVEVQLTVESLQSAFHCVLVRGSVEWVSESTRCRMGAETALDTWQVVVPEAGLLHIPIRLHQQLYIGAPLVVLPSMHCILAMYSIISEASLRDADRLQRRGAASSSSALRVAVSQLSPTRQRDSGVHDTAAAASPPAKQSMEERLQRTTRQSPGCRPPAGAVSYRFGVAGTVEDEYDPLAMTSFAMRAEMHPQLSPAVAAGGDVEPHPQHRVPRRAAGCTASMQAAIDAEDPLGAGFLRGPSSDWDVSVEVLAHFSASPQLISTAAAAACGVVDSPVIGQQNAKQQLRGMTTSLLSLSDEGVEAQPSRPSSSLSPAQPSYYDVYLSD